MDINLNALKIIFMGTPRFGAIILNELIKSGYRPQLVITAPDKPVGRGQDIVPSAVKKVAQKYNIQKKFQNHTQKRYI